MVACSPDWGQHDPEAGNQTYPSREVVATYSFEYSDETPVFSDVDRTLNLKTCEVVEVDSFGSNVLHLDSGYVRINNPLNNVTLQDGAAITMWVNIANEDLEKALFSFGYDEEDSAKFYFTPNAQLVYNKPGQLESMNLNVNDPSSVKTGALSVGSWHFIALQVADDGYQFYVDGELKANDTQQHQTYSTDFDYKTLLKHINNAPYLYIGAGADTLMSEVYYDDVTLIRNHMQEKDYNKKYGGSGSSESSKTYVTVGATDCSAGWWSTFSDYFTVPAEGTFHTKFINHTSGANNWNNWLLVATTDDERGGTNYSEYFVLRADAYGWGDSNYNGDNISSNYVWDTFKTEMEGATVDMTVTRTGSTIKMTTTTTTTSGTVYNYSYTQDNCGNGTQPIRLFLTVEAAYLEIDPEETYIGESFASGSNLVGSADCTAGWWSVFSDFYSCASGGEVVFHFINNNTGNGANYNNWLIVCATNGTRDSNQSYAEHFVLRSDAYGWGGAAGTYNADNMTQSFDWTTYVSDMHGAECFVRGKYDSGTVSIDAKQKTADGVVMPAYSYHQAATGDLGFFLTCEAASLDILGVGYYPYFDQIFETKE